MSPVKKFAGPRRIPSTPPVKPPPPPIEDDDEDDERLIRNVEQPGWSEYVAADKYDAMCAALLSVVPSAQPGLTQAEIFRKVLRHLPAALFPGGAKAQWWAKTVYLDLEAKKVLSRNDSETPFRWYRTAPVSLVEASPRAPWDLEEDPGARRRPHRHERRGLAAAEPEKPARAGGRKVGKGGAKGPGKGGKGPPRGTAAPEAAPPLKRAPKRPKGPQ